MSALDALTLNVPTRLHPSRGRRRVADVNDCGFLARTRAPCRTKGRIGSHPYPADLPPHEGDPTSLVGAQVKFGTGLGRRLLGHDRFAVAR